MAVRLLQRDDPSNPAYFPVGLAKLAILSLVSLGLYEFYWFYTNWKLERERTGDTLSPFWRAVFFPLFAYSLFRRIRNQAREHQLDPTWAAGWLALAFWIWIATQRWPDPYWLICFFSFVPLLPVQSTVNKLNARLAPEAAPNDRFTPANWVVIVVGTIFLALVALGALAPTTGDSPVPVVRPAA